MSSISGNYISNVQYKQYYKTSFFFKFFINIKYIIIWIFFFSLVSSSGGSKDEVIDTTPWLNSKRKFIFE